MRPATVHFTKIVNNKKMEMYLCEVCASEKNLGFSIPMDVSNFFHGFTGIPAEFAYTKGERQQDDVCKGCGMSYDEFRKTGKMGCSKCYDVYGRRMGPLLKRIHGSVAHTGKAPKKIAHTAQLSSELGKLKRELEAAVQREDYEKAAVLRDKIRDIEGSSRKDNAEG